MLVFLFLCWCLLWRTQSAFPLNTNVVDLSHAVDASSHRYPIFKSFKMDLLFNGTKEEYPLTGLWVQYEEYESSTHLGTHMDAPSHFVKGGLNIDQISIDQFIAPAAVIDITYKTDSNPDAGVDVLDLEAWETATGQRLDGKVVLLRTGWSRYYSNRTAYLGTPDNDITQLHFPGLESDAARWLVDNRRIVGIGTDAMSFDKGNSRDLMSHQILLGSGVYGLENVANLDRIPIYGAMLHVMPMKMSRASGAPTRILATFPDVIFP